MGSQKITVNGLKVFAFHGVAKEEELIGTYFLFDLVVDVDMENSIHSDHLTDTVDYSQLVELIKIENKQRSKLLEHLGGRIIKKIFDRFTKVDKIKLSIQKINPPISAELESVGVILEESRAELKD